MKRWINSDATAKTNNGGDDTIAAVSAMGYDAYYVALEALKKAGTTNAADILKVLPSLTYSGGVSGAIAFDRNGDAARDAAYVKKANTNTGNWDSVGIQSIK
jgi:branched-chain amino acid transport system substrate-binding protein